MLTPLPAGLAPAAVEYFVVPEYNLANAYQGLAVVSVGAQVKIDHTASGGAIPADRKWFLGGISYLGNA